MGSLSNSQWVKEENQGKWWVNPFCKMKIELTMRSSRGSWLQPILVQDWRLHPTHVLHSFTLSFYERTEHIWLLQWYYGRLWYTSWTSSFHILKTYSSVCLWGQTMAILDRSKLQDILLESLFSLRMCAPSSGGKASLREKWLITVLGGEWSTSATKRQT